MMKRFKLTREEAKAAIAKQDSDRRKLVRMFFQRDIDDPLLLRRRLEHRQGRPWT